MGVPPIRLSLKSGMRKAASTACQLLPYTLMLPSGMVCLLKLVWAALPVGIQEAHCDR